MTKAAVGGRAIQRDAPAFLSGMTEDELEAFKTRISADTVEAKELMEIEKAENVGRQAIKSAISMIAGRVGITQLHDGSWRSSTGDTV